MDYDHPYHYFGHQATPSQVTTAILQGIHSITNQENEPLPEKTREELARENAMLKRQIQFYKQKNNETRYQGFLSTTITWKEICNCVRHEMSADLALNIQKIMDDTNNSLSMNNTSNESINALINKLMSSRKYHFEEPHKKYFESLIQRAKRFDRNKRMFKVIFVYFFIFQRVSSENLILFLSLFSK